MKTAEAIYTYLSDAMEDKKPFLYSNVELLAELSEKDKTVEIPLIETLSERLGHEVISSLDIVTALTALTVPGYIPIDRTRLAAIVLASFFRGIELGKKIAETETLNNLFAAAPAEDN